MAFVHAETSTGALSDAKTLCALARQYDCLSIVDAVTSLGGVELRVDDWGIDANLFRQPEMPVVYARFVAGQF